MHVIPKESCVLKSGSLPRGGLPRNTVDRITDRPDITPTVDVHGKHSQPTWVIQ